MTSKSLISIVIPAYNEAAVLQSVLMEIPKTHSVGGNKYNLSVIVVNDGSTDETAKIAKKVTGVHVINHILNSGAGAATRTGLNFAKKLNSDFVITMDADGQHLTKDMLKVLKEITLGKYDMVIGSRLLDSKGMPWFRVLGNKGLSLITFLIFGVFVRDSQSGLRAYNRKAMEKISFHNNHYAFCSEIIWSAHRANLAIKEIPITAIYSDYSLSKGQSNWGALIIVKQLIKRRLLSLFYG